MTSLSVEPWCAMTSMLVSRPWTILNACANASLWNLLACAPTALIRVPSSSKVMSVLPGACVE